jgi:hypothetical protein
MPYRYYEATHHELDPKLGEYSRLEWAEGIPVLGELVPMGSERIWEVVAVDEFRLEEQTQPEFEADPVLFLNHCALKGESLPERSHWDRIGMFKENPLSILQIFVSEQRELIQSSIHFYGKKVKVGSYLKEYDYSKREFIKLPWRVMRLDSYLPEPLQSPDYCYAAIHIAHCVRVSLIESNPEKDNQILVAPIPDQRRI